LRPRVRSYADSSTATLSPGKMRIKFFRILPEPCASTWGLFSSSTRNIALGNGSTSDARTSIASSLLIHTHCKYEYPTGSTQYRICCLRLAQPRLLRQYQRPILSDSHAVLKMRAVAAILGNCGPVVVQQSCARLARVDHGFDRQDHAFFQLGTVTAHPKIRHLRLFVQLPPNAVPHEFPNNAETVRL